MSVSKKLIDLINFEFEMRKSRNSRYSKRAYAKSIGLSIGALSELTSGKRKFSAKYIEKVGMALGLGLDEIQKMLKDHQFQGELEKDVVDLKYTQIEKDTFDLISQWYYFALVHLIEKKNIEHDEKAFAEKLELPVSTIKKALNRLERLGLIEKKGKCYKRTGEKFVTTLSDDKSFQAAKNYQREILLKSVEALEKFTTEFRDHSSLTLLIKHSDLEKAKKLITSFRRKFSKILTENNLSGDVYQLQVSLFPLSKPQNSED